MQRAITLILFLLFGSPLWASDCVILLHGLLRGAGSMSTFEEPLQKLGFSVVNSDYSSSEAEIPALAEIAINDAIAQCPENSRLNFLTHSLGGILVRSYYAKNPERPRPFRVVMLAPPNHGTEVIDSKAFEWFGGFSGPAAKMLGKGENSYPITLGPVDYPVGVVAGSFSINPIFSLIVPGEDDGTVSIESTHVEGESDWVLISASHSFIMYNELAQRYALDFLQNGRFDHKIAE